MKGWIYIAANNRMPGLVKIGYTERDPDARAKELSVATGVPGNTEIKYMAWVEDVVNIERQLHGKFDATRDPGKEWFETKIADGIDALQTICKPIFEDIRTPLQVVSCTLKKLNQASSSVGFFLVGTFLIENAPISSA